MGFLTKGPDKNITSNEKGQVGKYRPNYKLQVTKKLNPFAYLIIGSIYTVAVIVTTLNVVKTDRPSHRDFSYSEAQMKKDILKEIRSMAQTNAQIRVDNKLTNQLEKFRGDMISEVNRMNIKYIEMLENNESIKTKLVSDLADREPASVKIQKGKAIVFNQKNEKLLRFVHKKEYKRAKENFITMKNKFVASLDLSVPADQERLRDFNDEMELALYELKQTHRMQRDQFKRNQYIVTTKRN